MSLTTNEIADVIMKEYYPKGYSPMVTNFKGRGLCEADVLGITPADYIVEFEIKRSRSDYRADFKKEHKHKCLSEGDGYNLYDRRVKGKKTGDKTVWFKIPNRFYYVCERDLIKKEEIPTYAGLIYIYKDAKNDVRSYVAKKAPLLHKQKADADLILSIAKNLTAKFVYGCSYMNWNRKTNLVT